MALQYQLKAGHYHLHDLRTPASQVTGEHRLRLTTDTVAIAFDARTGQLHDHGSPPRIHSWASTARRRMLTRLAILPHGKRIEEARAASD